MTTYEEPNTHRASSRERAKERASESERESEQERESESERERNRQGKGATKSVTKQEWQMIEGLTNVSIFETGSFCSRLQVVFSDPPEEARQANCVTGSLIFSLKLKESSLIKVCLSNRRQ